jgi:hypothetical protein
MGRRALLLIASILIAALGVGLIAIYVAAADQRAETAALRKFGPAPKPAATSTPTPTPRHGDLLQDRAISVAIDDPDRVMALLSPGDWVELWTPKNVIGKPGQKVMMPVVGRVRVVSVGDGKVVEGAAASPPPQTPTAILGLEVTPVQVRAILRAKDREWPLSVVILKPEQPELPDPAKSLPAKANPTPTPG